MTVQDHSHHEKPGRGGVSRNAKTGVALLGFLVVAGALLLTEHRAHVLGFLVWLPLLACLLMHMFMHGGGHHGSAGEGENQRRTS